MTTSVIDSIKDYYSSSYHSPILLSQSYPFLFNNVNNYCFNSSFDIFVKGEYYSLFQEFHDIFSVREYIKNNSNDIIKTFKCKLSDIHIVRVNSYFINNCSNYKIGYMIIS